MLKDLEPAVLNLILDTARQAGIVCIAGYRLEKDRLELWDHHGRHVSIRLNQPGANEAEVSPPRKRNPNKTQPAATAPEAGRKE